MRTSLDLCFCLLTLCGTTPVLYGVKVFLEEGSDAVLNCSLSTKEDLTGKIFLWMKDGQKVFIYRSGSHSLTGQDEQFNRRVSHFQDQLMNGNASIKIQNTTMADSGIYSCDFPRLLSQTFNIELLVGVKVVVEEGSDAVLPCLISTKEDITGKTFDWKKDGQKEVFIYKSGIHSINALTVQDYQFKRRVSHFEDQLMNGNASINIQNTKVADSGIYSCIFPRLHSQTFYIQLVVGASPEPLITTLDETKDWSLLQCEVRGASPKPKVEWQDSSGNILPAEEPQVSERGGRYYVTINITVTKNDHYRCVVTQEEISHQTSAETFVFINVNPSTKEVIGLLFGGIVIGAVVLAAVQALLVAKKRITVTCNQAPPPYDMKQEDGCSASENRADTEQTQSNSDPAYVHFSRQAPPPYDMKQDDDCRASENRADTEQTQSSCPPDDSESKSPLNNGDSDPAYVHFSRQALKKMYPPDDPKMAMPDELTPLNAEGQSSDVTYSITRDPGDENEPRPSH